MNIDLAAQQHSDTNTAEQASVSAASEVHDAALAFPETTQQHSESSLRALWTQSLIQTMRLVKRWARDPMTTIQSLLFPGIMLVMMWVVLGKSIGDATGQSALYGQVPMLAIIGSMFGASVGAVSLQREQAAGLLTRFWAMPVHRAGSLIGRLIAEGIRILFTTLVMFAVGVAIGFRFREGFLAGVAAVFLPLLFGLGFSTLVTAATFYGGKFRLPEAISLLTSLLMFFNGGFVPVEAYPTWLQGFVANQPMTLVILAMRGLTAGGPVAEPLWQSVAWSCGLILLFAYPAIRGYKRAAEPGRMPLQ